MTFLLSFFSKLFFGLIGMYLSVDVFLDFQLIAWVTWLAGQHNGLIELAVSHQA
jgi:hypothetical protein